MVVNCDDLESARSYGRKEPRDKLSTRSAPAFGPSGAGNVRQSDGGGNRGRGTHLANSSDQYAPTSPGRTGTSRTRSITCAVVPRGRQHGPDRQRADEPRDPPLDRRQRVTPRRHAFISTGRRDHTTATRRPRSPRLPLTTKQGRSRTRRSPACSAARSWASPLDSCHGRHKDLSPGTPPSGRAPIETLSVDPTSPRKSRGKNSYDPLPSTPRREPGLRTVDHVTRSDL